MISFFILQWSLTFYLNNNYILFIFSEKKK